MADLTRRQRSEFDALLTGAAMVFDGETREGGKAAASALRAADSSAYRRVRASSDPRPLIETACRQPGALPLAVSILACLDFLDWTHWDGGGLSSDVSQGLHSTELVGPDGHVEAGGVRVGLLVSDTWIDYPVSRHSGEETYLVISGTAEWTVSGASYAVQLPGTLIHHPAWEPHGRRTLGEVFLGAWRWSGDLNLGSFSVDQPV